jgi:RimJ/RimL family protein N-acetyltransferase
MEEGRRAHGFTRFVGMVHPENPASSRVLEKLGLRYEGLLEADGQGVRFRFYATPAAA